MNLFARVTVAASFATSLAACGANSIPLHGDVRPELSATKFRTPRATATVIFTLKSSGGSISERVAPSYISLKTRFINIALNGSDELQRFPCNTAKANYNCKFVLSTEPGRTQFLVMEYGDSGDELAEARFVKQLKSGTNLVNATMRGIVGTVELSIAKPFYITGRPLKQEVAITALDNGGAVIVGPDPYDKPILLQNSDRSGSTNLSLAKLTSPKDRLYLTYTGRGCANATVTADHAKTMLDYSKVTLDPEIVPSANYAITSGGTVTGTNMLLGSDGALWFAEDHAVARITTSGLIDEYVVPSTSVPEQLALGADGHIWVATGASPPSGPDGVDRVNDDGSLSAYPLPTPPANRYYYPPNVISGPQGDLWISYGYAIYSLTTTGTYSVEYSNSSLRFDSMSEVPDGDIWMRSNTGGKYQYAPGGTPQRLTGPIQAFRGDLFVNALDTLYVLGLSDAAIVDINGQILKRFDIPGPTSGVGVAVGAGSMWIPGYTGRLGYQSIGRVRLSDNSSCSYVVTGAIGKQYLPVLAAIGGDGELWLASGHYLAKASLPSM